MGDNKIHVDYLMHRNVNTRHKYIAKIGEGINARYFYTMDALNKYKQALSSKDEKAAYEKARSGPDVEKTVYDFGDGTKSTSYNAKTPEAEKRMSETREAYTNAQTMQGKIDAVKEAHTEIKREKAVREAVKDPKKAVEKTAKDAKKNLTNKVDDAAKEAKKAAKPVVNEVDKTADRAKYEAKKHAINAEATLRVKNAERKYGKESVQSYAEVGKGLAKLGANELLRALNEQGSGRADDAIVNTVKKGKKTLNRILGKR